MKAVGIIAEYNPFHAGHAWHLKRTREVSQSDVVVCIVSGCFSQRGLPSLLTLHDKTELALANGADLVLQLPAIYACQSADHFARYALESLAVLGIDSIVFGSETDDIEMLKNLTVKAVDPTTSQARNQTGLGPNDILGQQYVRWAHDLGISCISIPRDNKYISATQSRKNYFSGISADHDERFLASQRWESYYPFLRLYLMMSSPQRLSSLFLVTEGIENRLIRCARECGTWPAFLDACITKTYSRARIQRTCLMILMQVEKDFMSEHDHFDYALVSGFNEKGREYLREHEDARVITRASALPDWLRIALLKETELYETVLTQKTRKGIVYET